MRNQQFVIFFVKFGFGSGLTRTPNLSRGAAFKARTLPTTPRRRVNSGSAKIDSRLHSGWRWERGVCISAIFEELVAEKGLLSVNSLVRNWLLAWQQLQCLSGRNLCYDTDATCRRVKREHQSWFNCRPILQWDHKNWSIDSLWWSSPRKSLVKGERFIRGWRESRVTFLH